MSRISFQHIPSLLKVTVENWLNDRAPRLGAALAYYIALALAPMVMLLLGIAALALGPQAAQGRLVWEIQGWVGYEGAKAVQTMIEGAQRQAGGIAATLGLATAFFGATAAVWELRDALNTIWKVPDAKSSAARSLFNLAKEYLLSFALALGVGLFLLTSLLVTAWVSVAGEGRSAAAAPPPALLRTIDWVISFAVITVVFASIFKFLPNVALKWSDVAGGAILTSVLFIAGKFCLGVYLGRAAIADTYGSAASLVFFLVWTYYSAQVCFFGAEFTRAYACRFGSRRPPS